MSREIVTLQVGNYANFVGTHFWNLQEASFVYDSSQKTDLNHDILFQSGLNSKGTETFTPRLLLLDTQGSLGSLSMEGGLYQDSGDAEVPLCDGMTKIQQISTEKNSFLKDLEEDSLQIASGLGSSLGVPVYDLRSAVRHWSDFLRPHLHPRAIATLPGVWHNPTAGPTLHTNWERGSADLWGFGEAEACLEQGDFWDDVTDRLRRLAENCDNMQGFQLLTHSHDGMGGVSVALARHLDDEYHKKCLLAMPITPPNTRLCKPLNLLVNTVLNYGGLHEYSSALLPLSLGTNPWAPTSTTATLPHLSYQASSCYESSSVLALFLDTLTSCLRSKHTTALSLPGLISHCQTRLVTGKLQLPAYGVVTCATNGASVSGGRNQQEQEDRHVKVRRGQNRKLNEAPPSNIFIHQVADPCPTGSPFPHQILKGIELPPEISHINSVSAEASVSGGSEGREMARQMNESVGKLGTRTTRLIRAYGVTDDIWQQGLAHWRDLASNCGVDAKRSEEDDEDSW